MNKKSKLESVVRGWVMFLCVLAFNATAYGANTFTEPKGRFVIDLPGGWKLEPQTDPSVYVFKGTMNSNTIIIEYVEGAKSAPSVYNSAVNTLKAAGLPNAASEEEVKDLKVNENPARWGVYSDEMTYGSVKVRLYGLLGAVSLDKGGVYFLSILNKDDRTKFQQTYKTAFHSIRAKGQALTGASGETAAKPEIASTASSTFTHPSLSLTLPPSWASHTIPANFEKETVAWLKSENIPGASIIILCYRGPTQSYRSTRIRGLKTIAAAYPKGQTEMKQTSKLTTDSGFAATTELWKGFVASGSQVLALQSPMGIVKSDKGWMLMIGYVPDANGPKMEEDFSAILKSMK